MPRINHPNNLSPFHYSPAPKASLNRKPRGQEPDSSFFALIPQKKQYGKTSLLNSTTNAKQTEIAENE
jgi:hypothetical protein